MVRDEGNRRVMMLAAESAAANECTQCKLAIGQCGCNGGPRMPGSMAASMPLMPSTGIADSRFPGVMAGVGVNEAAASGLSAQGWTVVPPVARGGYPRTLCDQYGQPVGWSRAMREVMAAGKMEPYQDPGYDFTNMDVIYSVPLDVLPGVSTNVDLSPEIGTFALFYYRIVALDPTTRVEQVDWEVSRPQVPGCPVPCSTSGQILSPFVRTSPENMCGIPLTAFLDERVRNVPLRTAFLNTQAAGNLTVQIEGRGYCCSERIC